MASITSNPGELIQQTPIYAQSQTPRNSFRLSVLIPVYNERHVVEASVRRVLALEHPLISELEIIIVDDCSKDGTSDVLRRLAEQDRRITLIRHEVNKGKGGALRTGIAQRDGRCLRCA